MSELDPTVDNAPETAEAVEDARGDGEHAEASEDLRGDAERAEEERLPEALLSAISPSPRDEPSTEESVSASPRGELDAIVEALIFASPEPLTLKALCKLLNSEPAEEVSAAVERVVQSYERPGGLQLVQVAGGYQIVTRPELHEWVRRLFHEQTTQKLSVQALETLSVIAYKQPVTAAEITEIRGVNTSGVLNTLIERQLIKIAGRKQVVGRPFLYSTTREFLDRFGLKDLTDLPKIEDMADVLGFEPPPGLAEPSDQEPHRAETDGLRPGHDGPLELDAEADASALDEQQEKTVSAADPDEDSEEFDDSDEDFEDDSDDPDDSDGPADPDDADQEEDDQDR